jgi:hypothetical protein
MKNLLKCAVLAVSVLASGPNGQNMASASYGICRPLYTVFNRISYDYPSSFQPGQVGEVRGWVIEQVIACGSLVTPSQQHRLELQLTDSLAELWPAGYFYQLIVDGVLIVELPSLD